MANAAGEQGTQEPGHRQHRDGSQGGKMMVKEHGYR